MKTKEELYNEILNEIEIINKEINSTWSTAESKATNRIALANLYIALVNLGYFKEV